MEVIIKSNNPQIIEDLIEALQDIDILNEIMFIASAREVSSDFQKDVLIINIE